MKIGVVGCGALGSYYGARLWRAGHETHFLLRSDYEVVVREGVCIRSPGGDFTARPHCARDGAEIGVCDWVVIGLKTTANSALQKLLPPMVGPGTRVITLQNGLGNEDLLASLLPETPVYGGLCFVCLNRIAPGVVVHTAHGRVVMGAHHAAPDTAVKELAAAFSTAGVPCEVAMDLDEAHWRKLVWNIPFNGLGVAGAAGLEAMRQGRLTERGIARRADGTPACLPTDQLLSNPEWEFLVRSLMAEVISAAARLGHQLPSGLADRQIDMTRAMGAYWASTLVDFERGLPLELDSLFAEPLRRARTAGAQTPCLEALVALLTEMDTRRGEVP